MPILLLFFYRLPFSRYRTRKISSRIESSIFRKVISPEPFVVEKRIWHRSMQNQLCYISFCLTESLALIFQGQKSFFCSFLAFRSQRSRPNKFYLINKSWQLWFCVDWYLTRSFSFIISEVTELRKTLSYSVVRRKRPIRTSISQKLLHLESYVIHRSTQNQYPLLLLIYFCFFELDLWPQN